MNGRKPRRYKVSFDLLDYEPNYDIPGYGEQEVGWDIELAMDLYFREVEIQALKVEEVE